MTGKTVLIGVLACLAAGAVGLYAGHATTRSMLGSDWLREQARDVEDRVRALRHLREGDAERAYEMMESAVDADLIAMTVDRYIDEAAVARVRDMLDTVRTYRAAYPRETGNAFVDHNVARRLAGELTDDPAEQ